MQYQTPLLDQILASHPDNHQGEPRRMGIEIEFAGLEPGVIATHLENELGGERIWQSPFVIEVPDTRLGNFKLELDASSIKELGAASKVDGDPADAEPGFEKTYIEVVSSLASQLVPWEIVSPPIEFKALAKLFPLIERLRDAGAKGTRHTLHYAFGVHLNPELPDLEAATIVRYLKSFFSLYEWIKLSEDIDLARQITPYINHFEEDYIRLVLAHDYAPDTVSLIDDYLRYNPTRNRSLDLLPLLSFLDEDRVRATVADDRVNARPTFHYRLPNCDIDNPDWNLNQTIERWMSVEYLAWDDRLQDICDEYQAWLDGSLPESDQHWAEHIAARLGLAPADEPAGDGQG